MSKLAALLAKQKEASNAGASTANSEGALGAGESTQLPAGSVGTGDVPGIDRASPAGTGTTPDPAAQPADANPNGVPVAAPKAGLRFGIRSQGTSGDSGRNVPVRDGGNADAGGAGNEVVTPPAAEPAPLSFDDPMPEKPKGLGGLLAIRSTPSTLAEQAPKNLIVPTGDGGAFSLDDIAGFDTTDTGPSAAQIYADMIPADMPDRPLPEDMSAGMQGFLGLIENVYSVLNEPEIFGQTIRNLMSELAENPEYDKLLVDADVNTMMRGLRQTMGLAQIKKQSTKRGPAKKVKEIGVLAGNLDSMFGGGEFD